MQILSKNRKLSETKKTRNNKVFQKMTRFAFLHFSLN